MTYSGTLKQIPTAPHKCFVSYIFAPGIEIILTIIKLKRKYLSYVLLKCKCKKYAISERDTDMLSNFRDDDKEIIQSGLDGQEDFIMISTEYKLELEKAEITTES